MINFKNLGFGLTKYLAKNGVLLEELDGVFVSNLPDEITNSLIESYNPWPTEKAAKMAEINAWFDAAVGQLTAGTTQSERDSWAVQVNEAYGIRPVSMLAAMANARGIDLGTLIDKVKQKSELFASYYGAIQGKRDALEDLVKSFPDAGQFERLPELWAVSCTD
jgi:hypothetical protein